MASPFVLVVRALCVAIAIREIFSLQIFIVPKRAHLKKDGDNLTVTCHADQPITRCQFNFYKDEVVREGPFIDLSKGRESVIDRSFLGNAFLDYSYTGTGLDQGQCGITLQLANWKRYMLSCRVRGHRGGWRYDIMSFTADESSSIPVTVTPKKVVALPGTDLSILCKAQHKLEWCRMDLPGEGKPHIFLDQGADSQDSTPEHRYYGAGLEQGECGVTLASVTEEWNGYAFCGIVTNSHSWERTGIPVVVARAPDKPTLKLTSDLLQEGGLLEATCTVSGGRPTANVTWYLGEEVLRSDDEDDAPDDVWRWPTSLQRITQTLVHRLRAGDAGKLLRCEATHLALSRPLEASKRIHLIDVRNRCPPLESDTVQLSCYLAGEVVDCSDHQEVGTMADITCKPGYAFPPTSVYRRIICLRGGKWNKELFRCHPDCGRRKTNRGSVLVAGGVESKIGEFPWHVGVYEKTSEDTKQICGGTIITPNFVVSAAHCYWDSQSSSKKDATRYKVAAGKQIRAWEDPEPAVQKRDVVEVVTHVLFRGRDTNFASDIALLRLESSFQITTRVNLICIDWDNAFETRQLVPENVGVVAGWGFTENGVQSSNLMYVSLPYVATGTCLNAIHHLSVQLLTSDKFCAGYANKTTSVCRGDSGGGLVFRDGSRDKYYLRGVVSLAFPPPSNTNGCFSELYTGFTRFSQFISWIQDNV